MKFQINTLDRTDDGVHLELSIEHRNTPLLDSIYFADVPSAKAYILDCFRSYFTVCIENMYRALRQIYVADRENGQPQDLRREAGLKKCRSYWFYITSSKINVQTYLTEFAAYRQHFDDALPRRGVNYVTYYKKLIKRLNALEKQANTMQCLPDSVRNTKAQRA